MRHVDPREDGVAVCAEGCGADLVWDEVSRRPSRGKWVVHSRVVWLVLSTFAIVACAAATSFCTMASSVLWPLAVGGPADTSDMSSEAELPMLLMTSSSGMAPAGLADGCCGDIDADVWGMVSGDM